MNQTEATDLIAQAMNDRGFGVCTITPLEGNHRGTHILAQWFDTALSVTVEILAQP